MNTNINERWEEICNEYVTLFCNKHGWEPESEMWVHDDPGTTILIGDMYVGMDEIRYDIDNDIDESVFSTWYWKALELYELGVETWMNYESFCKGAPDEWPEERIQRLREAKQRLSDAELDVKRCMDEEKIKNSNYGGTR